MDNPIPKILRPCLKYPSENTDHDYKIIKDMELLRAVCSLTGISMGKVTRHYRTVGRDHHYTDWVRVDIFIEELEKRHEQLHTENVTEESHGQTVP